MDIRYFVYLWEGENLTDSRVFDTRDSARALQRYWRTQYPEAHVQLSEGGVPAPRIVHDGKGSEVGYRETLINRAQSVFVGCWSNAIQDLFEDKYDYDHVTNTLISYVSRLEHGFINFRTMGESPLPCDWVVALLREEYWNNSLSRYDGTIVSVFNADDDREFPKPPSGLNVWRNAEFVVGEVLYLRFYNRYGKPHASLHRTKQAKSKPVLTFHDVKGSERQKPGTWFALNPGAVIRFQEKFAVCFGKDYIRRTYMGVETP